MLSSGANGSARQQIVTATIAIIPRMGSSRLSWLSNSWLLKLLSLLRALRAALPLRVPLRLP
jgi:hypothetical protein